MFIVCFRFRVKDNAGLCFLGFTESVLRNDSFIYRGLFIGEVIEEFFLCSFRKVSVSVTWGRTFRISLAKVGDEVT